MSSSLLIRNLPKEVKTELRVRAARNGRSMEEEARLIFAAALAPPQGRRGRRRTACPGASARPPG